MLSIFAVEYKSYNNIIVRSYTGIYKSMYLQKRVFLGRKINSAFILLVKCIRNTLAIFYEMKNTDEHERF